MLNKTRSLPGDGSHEECTDFLRSMSHLWDSGNGLPKNSKPRVPRRLKPPRELKFKGLATAQLKLPPFKADSVRVFEQAVKPVYQFGFFPRSTKVLRFHRRAEARLLHPKVSRAGII